MVKTAIWKANACVAIACFAGGWLVGGNSTGNHTVHAAESSTGNATYELQGTGPDAQLSVYDSSNRTISVYQGAGSGSDLKPCSYQFQLGRPGAPIRRVPCAIGTLQ